jgi:beta-galactosidase
MRFGTSYYPEITPADEWDRDLRLMRDAGLTIVRVLDFAWTAMEPREGVYEWDWLDRFVELCDSHAIDLVLCTPTATPPAWLAMQYPQVMIELRDGTRRPWGSRRDVDPCSLIYRDFCRRIARAMAERYGQHDRVIGWQIDNELLGPEKAPPETHTPDAQFRFRGWLKDRYETIDALNDAWFLSFWSQRYTDWGEVTTPRHDRVTRGWALDYARFFTDELIDFSREQYEEIKPRVPEGVWVTHNSTAMLDRGLDHGKLAASLDCAAWDAYPGAASAGHGDDAMYRALVNDWLRASTRQPVRVLETGVGPDRTGLDFFRQLRDRGCDMALFWHWRQHRGNVEQNSQPVCDYAGEPFADRLAFVKELTGDADLRETPLPDVTKRADAAVVFDVDQFRQHLHAGPYGKPLTFDHLHAMAVGYRPLWEKGGAIDVIGFDATRFDAYELLVVPSPRLLDEAEGEALRQYVEAGGRLLITAKAALVDRHGVYHARPGSPLEGVTGVRSREEVREPVDITVEHEGQTWSVTNTWADAVSEPADPSTVVARYIGGPTTPTYALPGRPAALAGTLGRGRWAYATCCDLRLVKLLLDRLTA